MKASEWPRYRYAGTVVDIVDGDTVTIDLALGCRVNTVRRIRILGFDAPELFSGKNRDAGAAAKAALASLLPVGSRVFIETRLDRTSFDRLLGVTFIEGADGMLHDVAALMTGAGFGTPMPVRSP